MTYLISKKDSECFTHGKAYRVFDFLENGGFVVYDNDNERHFISGGFASENFNVCESVSILKCVEYINGFTVGNFYPVLEWIEGGATVVNDECFENWLSGLYGLAKFREV